MKNNKFIAMAVATTLALTSCESRQEQYEQDLINACNVKIMSDNSVTTRAISSCSGLDTSWTVNFGVAYVVNIANLPEINDVRYDSFEFYAELNGEKIVGFSSLKNQISGIASSFIKGNIHAQLSGHDELAVYLLHENMYNAKFYVETTNNKREIKLTEVY
jgi:hypothetical protein|tara:strand:+ start:144 stop:626 length:483 start_codon:yes stop_codon:yes gene_type:complete